jgi:6-pyruvoyltetrahydropterin/6-carboxytetrahydropterin synthase
MHKILAKIKYEYAHRLVRHRGKCRHLHGHSGEATIELSAETLDEYDFVVDFGDVKAPLKAWIDEHWDHAYLANETDPLLPLVQAQGLKTFSFSAEPTAEVMAKFLFDHVDKTLQRRPGVSVTRVVVMETCTGSAVYER